MQEHFMFQTIFVRNKLHLKHTQKRPSPKHQQQKKTHTHTLNIWSNYACDEITVLDTRLCGPWIINPQLKRNIGKAEEIK